MLVPLHNAPRDYDWGSTTLIAALQGRPASGTPEAEVWLGAHPGSPAQLPDGTPLDAWLSAHGHRPLPYLLKLLAAAAPLSIQVHPTRARAKAGFDAEERAGVPRDAPHRNYRDDNHKPEIIVAVSDRFEALAGLRDVSATRTLLATLPQTAGVRELDRRLTGTDAAAALRDTLAWLLSGDAHAEVDDVIEAVAQADSDAPEFDAVRRISWRTPATRVSSSRSS